MTAAEIVRAVMAERKVGEADFFTSAMRRHVRSRMIAVDRLRVAGFTKAEIAVAIRRSPSAIGYWLNGQSPWWRGGGPASDSPSIVLQVCRDLKVYEAEFFGRGRDARLVEARREAIRRLQAADFSGAAIARVMRRSHSTIYYWLNSNIRETKRRRAREYVLTWEARA